MSWRKFAVLVDGLPSESRTVTAQIDAMRDEDRPAYDGPEPTPRWGPLNQQIQGLRDDVRQLIVVTAKVAGDTKMKFDPLPRPTDRRSQARHAQLEARFARMQSRVKIAPTSEN